jgi:hypothetical protein
MYMYMYMYTHEIILISTHTVAAGISFLAYFSCYYRMEAHISIMIVSVRACAEFLQMYILSKLAIRYYIFHFGSLATM